MDNGLRSEQVQDGQDDEEHLRSLAHGVGRGLTLAQKHSIMNVSDGLEEVLA